jgi:hypothetical protein
MANLFTGVAAPDVNTLKTTASTAPQYFTDYLTDIAQAGTEAVNKPADQLVAPLQAMQTQGYAAVPAAATAYQPGLTAAGQTAASAAGVDTGDINRFMNPYTENVVNEMARLSQQNVQRNLLPTLKAGFVGTGGLGSQRYATALGQGLADTQANLTGQQYGALSSGYKSAVEQALQNAQIENQAAQTQANIAAKEQELGLAGASALTKAGAEQQAYEQAKIEAPLKTAANAAALLKGYTIPTTSTETYKGPMAGVYGNSPLSQIAGLGTLLGSGFNTSTGWGNQLMNWLKSGTTGSDTTGGTDTSNPDITVDTSGSGISTDSVDTGDYGGASGISIR